MRGSEGAGTSAREDCDLYGFRLQCTPEQMQQRRRCEERAQQQEAAWQKYMRQNRLPKDEKLKQLCRKVGRLFWSHCRDKVFQLS